MSMTAAYVTRLGPPSEIRIGDLPVPAIGPTDVLVEVDAVVVNPVDTYVRSGRYVTAVPMPFVIGRDLVGTVADVGSRALPFTPGDRVWCNSLGHDGRQGSFAQFACVPADRLYRLPDDVDPLIAVSVAHPAGTAYLGWFVHARLRPRETVFVGGAAGNVGTAAVQMAALAGARVVATARPDDHERCRAAGADVVLDYRDGDLAERVRGHAPDGVDVVWETSGHHDFDLVARVAAPGARVVVTAAAGREASVPLPELYTKDVELLGFVISRATVRQLTEAAVLINTMLAEGRLTTRITEQLPLAEAAEAHRRMEAGEVAGRLVLRPTWDAGVDDVYAHVSKLPPVEIPGGAERLLDRERED